MITAKELAARSTEVRERDAQQLKAMEEDLIKKALVQVSPAVKLALADIEDTLKRACETAGYAIEVPTHEIETLDDERLVAAFRDGLTAPLHAAGFMTSWKRRNHRDGTTFEDYLRISWEHLDIIT